MKATSGEPGKDKFPERPFRSYVSLFQIFLCRVLTGMQWVLKHVETKLYCEGVMPRTGG